MKLAKVFLLAIILAVGGCAMPVQYRPSMGMGGYGGYYGNMGYYGGMGGYGGYGQKVSIPAEQVPAASNQFKYAAESLHQNLSSIKLCSGAEETKSSGGAVNGSITSNSGNTTFTATAMSRKEVLCK